MRKIYTSIIITILGLSLGGTVFFVVNRDKLPTGAVIIAPISPIVKSAKQIALPQIYTSDVLIDVQEDPYSATNTKTYKIPSSVTKILDADYPDQGLCLPIKDIDGQGYTYLYTLNGVLMQSIIGCE